MITLRHRPDLVVGPRVWDRTGMLELEEQVLESPPSPSAVPHRSPSMGAGNLEWVPGLTTSDARHDMSVVVPPYITDTDAVVVCCTRARPSVRTVASFKYHRTVHVWLGGQVRGLSTRSGGVVCSMLRLDPYDVYPGSHRRGRARPLRRVTRSNNAQYHYPPGFCSAGKSYFAPIMKDSGAPNLRFTRVGNWWGGGRRTA